MTEPALDAPQQHPPWWSSVMGSLPDLVAVIDGHGYLTYVSPSSAWLLGRPAVQMVGHRACEFIAPPDRRNSAAWLAHTRASPDPPALVHRLARADGSYSDFETRLAALQRDGSGDQFVAVSRDISARTLIDQQMEVMADVWRNISDIVGEGVVLINDAGVVLAANRVAERLLAVTQDDLVGSLIGGHLALPAPGMDRTDRNQARITRLLTAPAASGLFCARRCDQQQPVWLQVHAVPLARQDTTSGPCFAVLIQESDQTAGRRPEARAAEVVTAPAGGALSPRELEVLRLLTDGLDVRAISTELQISIHTARYYVKSILRKLEVRTQVQAVVVALRSGLLDLS